ncbi:Hypothetical predicted protein, partial [Paramuricea clavata]
IRWSVRVPFELTFIDEQAGRGKESVLGSKVKSEGLVNPCVLKIVGDEISNKTTRWDVSFHEGILVEIKPKYVNDLQTFIKTYRSRSVKHASNSSTEVLEWHRNVPQADDVIDQDRIALSENLDKMSHRQEMCEFAQISANICDVTIDVKDGYDEKLLQVVMIHPKSTVCEYSKVQCHSCEKLEQDVKEMKEKLEDMAGIKEDVDQVKALLVQMFEKLSFLENNIQILSAINHASNTLMEDIVIALRESVICRKEGGILEEE